MKRSFYCSCEILRPIYQARILDPPIYQQAKKGFIYFITLCSNPLRTKLVQTQPNLQRYWPHIFGGFFLYFLAQHWKQGFFIGFSWFFIKVLNFQNVCFVYKWRTKSEDGCQIGRVISPENLPAILYHLTHFSQWERKKSQWVGYKKIIYVHPASSCFVH